MDGTKLALVWLFILGSPSWASEVCAPVAPEYLTRYDSGMALHSSAALVAGVLMLFPSAVVGWTVTDETILTTCPRDCYDACGIEVSRRDGAIRRVRGDRNHPVSRGRLCRKCATAYNGVLLDPRARLLTPLRRDGPKGSGRFRAVSWDEALAEIAQRLAEVVEGPGAHTILGAHYTGTFALLGYHFPLRFLRRLGAREVDPDTICNKAGHVALEYLYGTSLDGFDPRSASDAACIMVWGANPSASAPHQHEHWLPEAPGRVIVVDSIRTATAHQADLHLQLFPGSDAALAFAIAHVIRRDGLLDHELLRTRAIGWEELEPLLERCTPEWGERVTGVPADAIEQAARWYGTGPSLLWIGQGFQRQPRGGNAVRAVAQLAALSGNVGKPGTGFLYLNGAGNRDARRGLRRRCASGWLTARPHQPHGPGRLPRGPAARTSAVLLEHQHRRLQPRASAAPASAHARRTCSPSRSTCSRPTPPTWPTWCCRPRASSSQTISSPPTSISASPRR